MLPMSGVSRRGFFGLLAGAVAARFLPRAKTLFLQTRYIGSNGEVLSQGCQSLMIDGLQYWQTVPSDMVYLGIDRAPRPFGNALADANVQKHVIKVRGKRRQRG